MQATLTNLEQFDLAVFVSPTAVEQGLAALARPWPVMLPAAGIGGGSARALRAAGVSQVIEPAGGADSEHLLAHPALQDVRAKQILLVRGEGGRELLAEQLTARGAQLCHAVCYRRGRPDGDAQPLLDSLREHRLQAVTGMSSETLDNLLSLAGEAGREALSGLPLFVPHARIAEHASQLGFSTVIATGPGEDGLVAGIVEYFRHD